MFRRFVNSDNNHKKERKRRLYLFIHSQFTQFIMDLTPYPKNAYVQVFENRYKFSMDVHGNPIYKLTKDKR